MPSLMASLAGASDVVPFERVRVVLRREDGSVAADTTVLFPAASDSITLNLLVPLPINATQAGIPLALTMAYVNAQGDTVFRAGPSNVTARPAGAPGATTPVTIPTRYSGPGADAARVAITPDTLDVVAGDSSVFSAAAFDGQDAVLEGTPILFFTLDSTRAFVPAPGSGRVHWLPSRGVARIVAALPDGQPADTAYVSVSLPASQLVLAAGEPLVGVAGNPLGAPVVVRTLASDGVPVGGVEVLFAVATGDGLLSVAVDTTDAAGEASTDWTLGPAIGEQTITATAAGLTNSPLAIVATAEVGAPVAMALQDGNAQLVPAGEALAVPLRVLVTDANGNVVPGAAVAWTAVGGSVSADTTLSDASGIAAVTVTAGGVAGPLGVVATLVDAPAETVAFAATIEPAAPAAITTETAPAAGTAGATLAAFSVAVRDAFGNIVTSFAGPASLTAQLTDGTPVAVIVAGDSVDAAAGIVTFGAVNIQQAGTYHLIADLGALGTVVFDAIAIAPAAAATIALADGDAQTGAVNTLLPLPIRARVTDAFGNGVPGISVQWGTFSGEALPADSATLTDAAGFAQTTVQLGTAPGPAVLHAFNAALAGSPVSFTVTITSGPAAELFVDTEPAATVVAGAPITVVVSARDAIGNVATDFVGTVTAAIASGPAGAVLGGTTDADAVAGIATFSALTVDLAGTFTLRLTSPGLSDTVTVAFDVTPAAAASILLLDGDAQADTVSFGLANPLRVEVVDAFGNPVAGVPVGWQIVSGGGGLSADTSVTDAAGIATNSVSLPTVAGTLNIEASVDGLTGSPVAFTATAIPAVATSLVVVAAPDTVVAGVTVPTITVEVRDPFGNVVTWFAGDLSIAATDAPGAIATGTTTRSPIAGVVTFDDLTVNEPGAWFLGVSGGGLATSLDFEVVAGAAASFTLLGGDAQTGLATQPLPTPLAVQLTDAVGNPVVGEVVVFQVAAGGGTLSSGVAVDSVLTNSAGDAFTTWTLGTDTFVTHSVAASYPGFADIVFTATAQALVANRTWTGATSTLWQDASNWAENAIPVAGDSVLIPASPALYPELGANAVIGRLTIQDGATLNLSSFSLTVDGALRAPSALSIAGVEASLVMSGTATLRGSLPFLTVTGNVTLGGTASVAGLVVIDGGNLTVGAQSLVTGALETQNGGTLTMTDPLGSVAVSGNAAFYGGSTAGLLTAGTLSVGGDFYVGNLTVDAFSPSAAHTVVLNGAAVQAVSFDQPDTTLTATCATSCFGTLSVPKTVGTGGVLFTSSVKSLGTMSFAGDSVSALGHALISTGAPEFLVNSTVADRIGWQEDYSFTGSFTVDTMVAWGTGGAALPISENIPTIVAGSHRIVGAFNAGLVIEGTLDVDGSAAISATLDTRGAGHLRMTDASDTLLVAIGATFAGTATAADLTAGHLEIAGDFTQVGAGVASFVAENAAHTTRFTGTSASIQVDALALNPLGTMRVADGAALTIVGVGLQLFGDVILEGASATVGGTGGTVYIEAGGLVDSVGGRWTYDNTQFGGVNPVLPTSMAGSVAFTNAVTLQQNFSVPNNLSIAGSNAAFDVGGFTVTANVLQTALNGRLVMDAAEDSVLIAGNAFFQGGQSILTDGYLEIGGSFTQSGDPLAFQAAAPHETWLVGSGGAPVSFAHPGFGPDSSHFGVLYHSKSGGAALTLGTDVYVNGAFETGATPGYAVSGTGQRLVSRGAAATDVTFTNVRWELVDGAPIAPLSNITFTGMDATATQLRIARSGGTVTVAGLNFGSVPTTGLYLRATDTDVGNADDLVVALSAVTPATSGGYALFDAPASITGWDALQGNFSLNAWTGAVDGNWSSAGNWSLGRAPLATDSVVIAVPGAYTVSLDVSATVGYLDVGDSLSAATPTLAHAPGTTLQVDSISIFYPGSAYSLTGGSTLAGGGSVLVFGNLVFDGASMTGDGVTAISAGGTGSIASTGQVALTDRALVVSGPTTVGAGGLAGAGLASIGITDGGLLDFQTANSLFLNGTTDIALTGGTLRISPPGAGVVRIDWPVSNAGGRIEVASGTLDLREALAHAGSDSIIVRTGATLLQAGLSDIFAPVHVESGGLARFTGGALGGTHIFSATSSVSGPGSFEVDGATLVEIGGAFDVGNFTLSNATFDVVGSDTVFVGNGAYTGGGFLNGTGVLAIRGAFSSTGGNPNGTGTIAVLPGGELTWQSPLRGWNLDIAGTMVWGDWSLSLETHELQNPGILIRAGGLLDIQHGALARDMFANTSNVITNLGSIVKSSGTANTNIRAQVLHDGFMNAVSGQLSFQFACIVGTGTFGGGAGTITNCGP